MIVLNNEQQAAKEFMVKFFTSNRFSQNHAHKFMTFYGSAGTGKSTTLWKVLEDIPSHMRVGFGTPTNKSAKVLRKMVQKAGLSNRVMVGTIHSFLGLVMKRVRGDEVLVKEKFAEEKVFDILCIDEAGMLNDELLMYILDSKSDKVAFIGDKCQIGPINSVVDSDDAGYVPRNADDISRVFTDVEPENMFGLNKIMRQGDGSPIIDYATLLRDAQDGDHIEMPLPKHDIRNGDGVALMQYDDWLGSAIRGISSQAFMEDSDLLRIICYTNEAVDDINNKVRNRIFADKYPDGVPEYVEGEILVAQSCSNDMSYKNADELRIVKVEDNYDEENEVYGYKLTLEHIEDHTITSVVVASKKSRDRLNYRLTTLAEKANAEPKMAAMYWGSYWGLKKGYAEFKHIYACTAHKSQGSTYKYTYVYTPDFIRFGSSMTVKRLMYTATTRSESMTLFAYM